jgi:membrane fusion protein, multidrug efflux system
MSSRVSTAAGFVALACSILACSPGSRAESDPKPGVPITAALVERKDSPIEIHTIGAVQPYSTVTVKPQIAGQIAATHFTEGQEVHRGDRLFDIDPRPFEAALRQAEGNLARDVAQAENAAADFRRLAKLLAEGIVSQEEYDRAKAQSDSQLAAAKADRAGVENAKLRLQYCSIDSPIDGRVGQILVHAGNIVKENETPLAVINQLRPVYVSFSVPQHELAEIHARMAAGKLSVTALPPRASPQSATTTGELVFVDNTVDAASGTVLLKALFANDRETLWPGLFVDVVLTLSIVHDAVVAPSQAILPGQEGTYVFVVKADKTVETRPVVVARQVGSEAVIENGLEPGETVVVDGQIRLAPGVKVSLKETAHPG